MLEQTISNLQWALAFNILTCVLNLISIALALVSARRMRAATKMWREAAQNYRTASNNSFEGASEMASDTPEYSVERTGLGQYTAHRVDEERGSH